MSGTQNFNFGSNWERFLGDVDEARIAASKSALSDMLGRASFAGLSFLDIGSGSGLASLAARILGARVYSFDANERCVTCTTVLKEKYFPGDSTWTIRQASALDESFFKTLPTFDIVYSWGVFHHTGNMNKAIQLAASKVAPGGVFFLSIYNDQGVSSKRWRAIKKLYNTLPAFSRWLFVFCIASFFEFRYAMGCLLRGKNPLQKWTHTQKNKNRGMSVWHDWVDWVGGYPFEVATPETIINLLVKEGFSVEKMNTVGHGWGCNEFVFRKSGAR